MMRLFGCTLFAGAALLALTTSPALAIPITWQLQNAVLANQRTATGSLVFNDDTQVYSNIDITTQSSPTNVYTFVNPSFSSSFTRVNLVTGNLADYTNTPALVLVWSLPFLTNAGGTVPFSLGTRSYEATCENADCSAYTGDVAFISGQAASVAAPSSLALLTTGLFGLAIIWYRRRVGMPAVVGHA